MMPVAVSGDDEIIRNARNGKTNEALDALQQRYAGGFDKAVTTTFGSGRDYPQLERNLRLNASRFGTYKAYDLSRKLDGLSEEEARKVLKFYNGTQKTEYNTLVSRARSAKQFERFKEEADLYPNLEWLLTRSATPRETHLAFVGIILPITDPFWRENQPGNEYGCKCDWRTTDKPGTAAPSVYVPPAQGLEGNPTETGELVTRQHPYFDRNPQAPGWLDRKAVLQAPEEVSFISRATEHGSYLEHLLVEGTYEAAGNRAIAELLLSKGYKDIKLMPQIYVTEKRLRERYFGKTYASKHPSKNPDFKVGSSLMESKGTNRRNLSQQILKASKQADSVIIRLNEPMNEATVKQFIKGQWLLLDRSDMQEIIIYMNGNITVFKRP